MNLEKHPDCDPDCQAAELMGWAVCEQLCQVTRRDRAQAAVDAGATDERPAPMRGRLDPVTLLETLEEAWAAAARVPNSKDMSETAVRRFDAFEGAIIGLLHADPASESRDAWSRMGAHAGALHGWSSTDEMRYPPKGAPSPQHVALHVAGWTIAANFVWAMRRGVVS